QWQTLFGDIDGDGYADLVNINLANGDVYVHLNQQVGFSNNANFLQQQLAVPTYPTNAGWDHMLADYDGDGRADFVNFSVNSTDFYFHHNNGGSFSTVGTLLRGPREVYEHEYFLADTNGDKRADIVQHNLRDGDILGYPVKGDPLYIGQFASLR